MKNLGDKFNKMMDKINKDDEGKRDFCIPANQLYMTDKGTLVRKGREHKGGLVFGDYAMTQLLNRYNVPVKEAKLVKMENPDYFKQMLNDILEDDLSDVLLRTKITSNDTGVVRAVLSENYSVIDNNRIAKSVIEGIGNSIDADVQSFYLDDKRFHSRIVFNPTEERFGNDINGFSDIIKIGVDIVNSEIGASSLRIEPMIYRLICCNGLKTWSADGDILRQRHIYIGDKELNDLVAKSINTSIEKSEITIRNFEESKSILVPNAKKEIVRLCDTQKFTDKLTKSVLKSYYEEPMPSRYGIVNAFTRSARDLNNDQRLKVEMFAGRLLTDSEIFKVA